MALEEALSSSLCACVHVYVCVCHLNPALSVRTVCLLLWTLGDAAGGFPAEHEWTWRGLDLWTPVGTSSFLTGEASGVSARFADQLLHTCFLVVSFVQSDHLMKTEQKMNLFQMLACLENFWSHVNASATKTLAFFLCTGQTVDVPPSSRRSVSRSQQFPSDLLSMFSASSTASRRSPCLRTSETDLPTTVR